MPTHVTRFSACLLACLLRTTTLVEQPAAQVILQPEPIVNFDVVLFYDMSGIPDVGLRHDGANNTGQPPAAFA